MEHDTEVVGPEERHETVFNITSLKSNLLCFDMLMTNSGRFLENHDGFFGFDQAYHHYVNSLLLSMRHFEGIRDDARLAVVLRMLLKAERPWVTNLQWQHSHELIYARFSEILLTIVRFLSRHSKICSTEHLRRLVRKSEQYQLQEAGKWVLREMAVKILLQSGRVSDAYDAMPQLSLKSRRNRHREKYHHEKMLGMIRKQQWLEEMRRAGGHARTAHDREQNIFIRYQNIPSVWGKAGRNARQLAEDARNHLTHAWKREKRDSSLPFHIVELLMSKGDIDGAQDIVREHAIHSPFDIDAQALRLSFLLMSMDTEDLSDKEVKETCLKIVETCKLLLVLDSDCVQTIQVLLKVCKLHSKSLIITDAMEALFSYVEIGLNHVECKNHRIWTRHALVEIQHLLLVAAGKVLATHEGLQDEASAADCSAIKEDWIAAISLLQQHGDLLMMIAGNESDQKFAGLTLLHGMCEHVCDPKNDLPYECTIGEHSPLNAFIRAIQLVPPPKKSV